MEGIINTENPKKYFNKITKNVLMYILNFTSYGEFPKYLMVNKTFLENIRLFIKYKISKDKNIMEFYKKHLFLLNHNCNKNFQLNILPLIRSSQYISKLFENESLIIKKYIFSIEEEIIEGNNFSTEQMNNLYTKIRKNVLNFISKIMNQYLLNEQINELYLDNTNIGSEGAIIIATLIKLNKNIGYIDFSYSILSEEDLKLILNSISEINDFFSINLSGVSKSLSSLKFIKFIKSRDYKVEIISEDNELSQASKCSSFNNKRFGKIKKYKG